MTAGKRLFDILLASVLLTLTSPLMLVAALVIYLRNPGPIFFRSRRLGLRGRIFTMFKFRTMYQNTSLHIISNRKDGQVFPGARWLRHFKIDELPQLLNVLRGDMSIVGPRPRISEIKNRCDMSLYRKSLEVRPGLTSPGTLFYLSQGEDLLNQGDPEDAEKTYLEKILPRQLEIDIAYLQEASLWKDLWIIVRTVGMILGIRHLKFDSETTQL